MFKQIFIFAFNNYGPSSRGLIRSLTTAQKKMINRAERARENH
jgi:hypothetical protein